MALNKTNPELPSLQPLHREAPQTSPPSPAAGVLRARCLRGARGCARPLTPGGRQYNFDTNWMRLWNYNPEIEDPDHLIRSFLPITIGSTYRVQPGDTLSRVAARLREKRMQQPVPHAHRARVLLAPGAFRAPRGASPSARGGQRVEQRSDDRGQQLPS